MFIQVEGYLINTRNITHAFEVSGKLHIYFCFNGDENELTLYHTSFNEFSILLNK